jgi:hypothetical protein
MGTIYPDTVLLFTQVYSIQHYVIKLVSDLRQVGGILRVLRFAPSKKNDLHDITEILLKVALNTIATNLTMITSSSSVQSF